MVRNKFDPSTPGVMVYDPRSTENCDLDVILTTEVRLAISKVSWFLDIKN